MRLDKALLLPVMLLLLSCATKKEGKTTEPKNEKYNILWLVAEDMSPWLASFGDSTARTPNLDALAAEGVRYTHVFSISGVCAPSRSALITGMYPTSIGSQNMRTWKRSSALKPDNPLYREIPLYETVTPPMVKCFPEYLRAAGYYCTNNSKTDYQFAPPITAWDESSNKAHWRNQAGDKPFFSVFNFGVTHESQIWKKKDDSLRVDPAQVPLPPYYPDNAIARQDVARAYSNIEEMDEQVGEILQQLKADGLYDKTIIFFYTDHGAGLPRHKREVYDQGTRVPMIIRFPGAADAGTVNDELISFVDFAPTILSLADLDIPGYMQGQAFLGSGKSPEPRKHIHAARDRMDSFYELIRAVRDKRFLYLKNYLQDQSHYQENYYRLQMPLMRELLRQKEEGELTGVQKIWFEPTKPEEELYDTWEDPYHFNNLADDPEYRENLNELRGKLDEWQKQYGDLGLIPEKELAEKMWPGGVQPETGNPEIKIEENKAVIQSPIEGASIAYQVSAKDEVGEKGKNWLLYTGPLEVSKGDTIKAIAIRIGYKQSQEQNMVVGE